MRALVVHILVLATAGLPAAPVLAYGPKAADIQSKCDVFRDVKPPKGPDDPHVDEKSFTFTKHCSPGGVKSQACAESLGMAYKYYNELKTLTDDFREKVCLPAVKSYDCKAGQADYQKCVGGHFKAMGEKAGVLSSTLDKAATKLDEKAQAHRSEIKKIREEPRVAASTIKGKMEEIVSTEVDPGKRPAVDKFHTNGCMNKVKHSRFCGHATPATDATYYVKVYREIGNNLGKLAKDAGVNVKVADANLKKGGSDDTGGTNGGANGGSNGGSGDKNKKEGLLDKVGGLDGLVKWGTLGLMGAGLYCSVSGACTPKKEEDDASSASADYPNGNVATSPTPASEAQLKQESGELEKAQLANVPGTEGDSKTGEFASNPFPVQDYSSDGSGFSAVNDNTKVDPATNAFGRAPAGGLGGDGGSSDGSSSSRKDEADLAKMMGNDLGGLGTGLGGGGLGGSSFSSSSTPGSFSLGDTPSTSATDSALKDILNGDTPLGDTGLTGLADGSSALGAGDATELQGEDSLFMRVKETHSRCLKRGWVAQTGKSEI